MASKTVNGISEWRGYVTATLQAIEKAVARVDANVAAMCARVDCHETDIAVLKDQRATARLSNGARGVIISSFILAAASIAVALIKR